MEGKTKVRVNKVDKTSKYNLDDVGYIDGYIFNGANSFAVVIIDSNIFTISVYRLTVINEGEFKEGQSILNRIRRAQGE